MSVGIIAGNVASITVVSATVDLGSVAANTSEAETATVPGVLVGDFVIASKPSVEAGLMIGTCRVTAANTVEMTVMNTTAGAIDEASETITFLVIRPEGASAAAAVHV